MSKELYFIESGSGTKNYDLVAGSYDANYYFHSYNFNYPFKFPIINPKKITLKSVELPIGTSTPNNIRYQNGTTLFSILYSRGTDLNISRQIYVPPGAYTTISSLITALNAAIVSANLPSVPNIILTSGTSAITGQTVCYLSQNCTSFTLYPSALTYNILGFSSSVITTSSSPTIGIYPANVFALDTCYYMRILNLPVQNNNIVNFTFKIPLNNIVNNTVYFNDVAENQSLTFKSGTNTILDKLSVVLVDSLGNTLIGYYNWSFTLIIESDEIDEQETLDIDY